jgi:hypothetical protein
LRKADDFYATGITIWEISAGCVPFDDIDEEFLEDIVADGFQPQYLIPPHASLSNFIWSQGKNPCNERASANTSQSESA